MELATRTKVLALLPAAVGGQKHLALNTGIAIAQQGSTIERVVAEGLCEADYRRRAVPSKTQQALVGGLQRQRVGNLAQMISVG